MRYHRFLVLLIFLLPARTPHAQSGSHGGFGQKVAPGIEVLFSPSGPTSCAWRFRNMDPVKTLESMRFTYTYASSPLGRVPLSTATTQTNEDTLAMPLAPFEESDDNNIYRAAADCRTVNIRITATRWN